MLKSTLVVDNDSVPTQHAFSPTVLTMCSLFSLITDTDARSAMAQEKDPRFHHGSVALGGVGWRSR